VPFRVFYNARTFDEYCSFFDQGSLDIRDSFEAAIKDNVSAIRPERLEELEARIQKLLSFDDARLKDITNNEIGDNGFSNTHGLRYFLQSLTEVRKQTQKL
jgi:hypothetical protein